MPIFKQEENNKDTYLAINKRRPSFTRAEEVRKIKLVDLGIY